MIQQNKWSIRRTQGRTAPPRTGNWYLFHFKEN